MFNVKGFNAIEAPHQAIDVIIRPFFFFFSVACSVPAQG